MKRFAAGFLLMMLVGLASAGYAQAAPQSAEDAAEAGTAPVRLDGRTLLMVSGVSSLPAGDRAEAISRRLQDIADEPAITIDSIGIVPGPQGPEIRAAGRLIMAVTTMDAEREGVAPDLLAATHRIQFADALLRYRAERPRERVVVLDV